MAWQEPIYDRTQRDVTDAIAAIADWIKAVAAGETVNITPLKGCLNLSDLNRIEGNIRYLADTLISYGYNPSVSTKVWADEASLPSGADISRILSNVQSLVSEYYVLSSTPRTPYDMKTWSDINAIEKILYDILQLIQQMIAIFRPSNTFNSNATVFLPIYRG